MTFIVGFFNDMLDVELPEIEITIAKAITATSVHIKLTFHLDALDVDFELSVLFVKRTGGKKWSTVLYAGIDIPNDKFETPKPWVFVVGWLVRVEPELTALGLVIA
jgi:hypothetical protein